MPNSHQRAFESLRQTVRQTAVLASIEELLGWDERTMMPTAAGEHRAEQMTVMTGLVHQRWTDPKLGDLLDQLAESALAADPHSDWGATVRQVKRRRDKRVKLPQTLVEELTRTSVLAQQAWVEARRDNDFASFRPWLEKTFELKRQEAEALGYEQSAYDALLDEYEPYERADNLAQVLGGLREQLVPLVEQIVGSSRQPDESIVRRTFPVDIQAEFAREAARRIGFDFDRGRLDVTTHPFCTSIGPDDCRITTRYNQRFFNEAFFGVMHEAGHGIYDQGLRAEHFGLPPGEYVSLGIHESQSRLWENLVGRSRPFWDCFFPEAKRRFPEALGDVSVDAFHFAVNRVAPSLIRVEADELTYNLHILIRFELEQALLADDLPVADLPEAWNAKYRQYLGIQPTSDAEGVLQDIHWAAGLVGYFPTYSLGNLHAAQLFAQAQIELGDLAGQVARGEFEPLRRWLRENVHRHGQCYSPSELIQRITGKPLSAEALMDNLRQKLTPLYGLD